MPLMALVLASCGTPSALDVRPMHLRTLEVAPEDEPMIRGEQQRRFHGAVGVREREQRLGHYYTVLWNDEDTGPEVTVRFEYQQGSTGSKVLRQEQKFDGGMTHGKAEFKIIGQNYIEQGRVLAWRCSLWRGGREIASRQSYLWE